MKATKSRANALRQVAPAGAEFPVTEVPATEAKNRFGGVLAEVEAGTVVAIVRHNTRTAVMMPMSEYQRLSKAASRKLNLLTGEFDALLARMQSAKAGVAMTAAFHATPAQMAKAAIAAAAARRKHG